MYNTEYTSFWTYLLKFNSKNIETKENIVKVDNVYYLVNKADAESSVITSCFVSKNGLLWTMGFVDEFAARDTTKAYDPVNYYIYIYSPSSSSSSSLELIASTHFNVYPFMIELFVSLFI